ncbi:unnamed protein product [Coffea canephora]|uniref:DUF7903 domain-containing protein n=1 Tax=Coffea canephora TaxID=49390 RepID=A0A068U7X0_COFCA|nr:unnamed protein product [Coffea canephora]
MAAYIPPHKRHSRGGGSSSSSAINPSPSLTPESLSPHFKRGLNFRSSFSDKKKNNRDRGKGGGGGGQKIIYDQNAVSKWFPVGLAASSGDDTDNNDTNFMSLTRLQPISVESFQRKSGEKPLSLVLNHDRVKECSEERSVFMENPWLFAAENVMQDLRSAFQRVQNEVEDNKLEEVKPTLVARVGQILFHGGQSTLPESSLRQLKRSFYTNVSASYMEYIVDEVVPKCMFDFQEEKEIYHIKLSDNMRPDSTISCKCTLAKDREKLEFYKIEWNQVRHLVVDMSCLEKDLDLRLMLCTKRIIKTLTDNEIECIKSLIGSAVLDPDVKGGLRWPLGLDSSGDRYAVVGVWHVNAKSFRNSSIRLKARHADRFDFRTSSGEVSREVAMKMKGIVSNLPEQTKQDDLLHEMLSSNLKLIWENCLCFSSIP